MGYCEPCRKLNNLPSAPVPFSSRCEICGSERFVHAIDLPAGEWKSSLAGTMRERLDEIKAQDDRSENDEAPMGPALELLDEVIADNERLVSERSAFDKLIGACIALRMAWTNPFAETEVGLKEIIKRCGSLMVAYSEVAAAHVVDGKSYTTAPVAYSGTPLRVAGAALARTMGMPAAAKIIEKVERTQAVARLAADLGISREDAEVVMPSKDELLGRVDPPGLAGIQEGDADFETEPADR